MVKLLTSADEMTAGVFLLAEPERPPDDGTDADNGGGFTPRCDPISRIRDCGLSPSKGKNGAQP